jgi:hydroxyethylthiazole kinase-like uncharacterized protein yjeF
VILRADWTLALLSPAPGLWMGQGRDHAGEIWFDDLGWSEGQSAVPPPPSAWLHLQPAALGLPRPHAGHKGRFGSVRVVGGAPGMSGAAVLAARAALQAGAGKVHLHDLSADTGVGGRVARGSDLATAPELMASAWSPSLSQDAALWRSSTVVAGCGGGQAIALALPGLIDHATRLVLDADALNVLAAETGLRAAVQQRGRRGLATVLTPHPLEAARLLGRSTAEVQADRLACAQTLAEGLQAAVILKGSGSVLALPDGDAPWINPTGHAALATAGSGDVLAGWLGGLWSQLEPQADDPSTGELRRCCALAMWTHGRAAELASPQGQALPAGQLVEALGSFLRQGRW